MEPRTGWNPARLLEHALLFTFVVHALAMLSMALLLLPAMPGGGTPDDMSRIRLLAEQPWRWRLGWSAWGLTALSDLLLALALLKTPWIPRGPALLGAIVTAAAVVPDQYGQLRWMTAGVALAREALRSGDAAAYLAFEARTFVITAAWGAGLYTCGAVVWTWCFAKAGTWSRSLSALSALLWPLFAFVSVGPLLPPPLRPAAAWISAGNAVGFVLMELWFALVTEQVLRRGRPATAHGRNQRWRHPGRGVLARAADVAANSRFLRALVAWLPPLAMESDIQGVVYVSYLVDAERLLPYVPEGLELQRLGPGGGHGLFTFLTFRHGHFGPRGLGPLRRALPSPVQTNWRIHVRDPRTGQLGIYFVTNAVDSTPHALAARLLSEGMPMHVLARADLGPERLVLEPGAGSGPDAEARLRPAAVGVLPEGWKACFEDYAAFLTYCVPQDRALSTQPWLGRSVRHEIQLDIPLAGCEPLEGEVRSRAAAAIAGAAPAVLFRVPGVRFRFAGERYDAWDRRLNT